MHPKQAADHRRAGWVFEAGGVDVIVVLRQSILAMLIYSSRLTMPCLSYGAIQALRHCRPVMHCLMWSIGMKTEAEIRQAGMRVAQNGNIPKVRLSQLAIRA